MKYILLVVILAVVAALTVFRVSSIPADWHADPFDGTRTGKPNDYLIGPGGDRDAIALPGTPSEVLARIDAAAMAEPRVTRLAGSVEAGHVTYVQRSRIMGFPDAISVRAMPDGDGSRLAIWSRARWGQSDLGVNAQRVARWLSAAEIEG